VNATKTCKRHNWGLCLLGTGDKHCVQTCTRCGDTRRHGQRLSDRALAAKAKKHSRCDDPNCPLHGDDAKSQTRQRVR
jgi:hypothetical protein